jgi:hypothetical protein
MEALRAELGPSPAEDGESKRAAVGK